MDTRDANSAAMADAAKDASLMAAALRHYAVKCREKRQGIVAGTDAPTLPECDVDWLTDRALRADELARDYEKLARRE